MDDDGGAGDGEDELRSDPSLPPVTEAEVDWAVLFDWRAPNPAHIGFDLVKHVATPSFEPGLAARKAQGLPAVTSTWPFRRETSCQQFLYRDRPARQEWRLLDWSVDTINPKDFSDIFQGATVTRSSGASRRAPVSATE
jgi:hypothetical protein